ncbi:MAG: hypothetical protein WC389_16780 [Lutibacter sp.]|jgi:hypothetical protein
MNTEFMINDKVKFLCRPYLRQLIVVYGEIKKIYETVVGSKVKKQVAQIGNLTNYPFNKSTTTIILEKLIKIQ